MCVLSVLIPVLNDERYIQQCLESALTLSGPDVEICISDNSSTDSTWTIVSDFAAEHSNIKCARHAARVSVASNFASALHLSSGDLIFFLGSDDYLVAPGLESAVKRLESAPTLAGIGVTMNYFSESTGRDLLILPPSSAEKCLNGSPREAVSWMINNINHDELIYSVWRRSAITTALTLVQHPSQESIGWWWALYAMLVHDSSSHRFEVTSNVVLMKRYEKPKLEEDSQKDAQREQGAQCLETITWKAKHELKKRINSVRNSIRLWNTGSITKYELLMLLLSKRYHSDTRVATTWLLSIPFSRILNLLKRRK